MNLALTLIVCFAFAVAPSAQAKKGSRGDSSQRAAFRQANPCPSNGETSGECPGFVIDYIRPRSCGGADRPENMQWRSVEMAKHHDKAELKACDKVQIRD
jgi:hypothetical protein